VWTLKLAASCYPQCKSQKHQQRETSTLLAFCQPDCQVEGGLGNLVTPAIRQQMQQQQANTRHYNPVYRPKDYLLVPNAHSHLLRGAH
jgi:hypothetical protein